MNDPTNLLSNSKYYKIVPRKLKKHEEYFITLLCKTKDNPEDRRSKRKLKR